MVAWTCPGLGQPPTIFGARMNLFHHRNFHNRRSALPSPHNQWPTAQIELLHHTLRSCREFPAFPDGDDNAQLSRPGQTKRAQVAATATA